MARADVVGEQSQRRQKKGAPLAKKAGHGLLGRAKIKVALVSLGGECHNYGLRKALTAKVLAAKVSRGLRCS